MGERWYDVEVVDLDSDPVNTVVDGVPVEVSLGKLVGAAEAPQSPAPTLASGQAPQARKEFFAPASGVIMSVSVCEGDQVVTGDEVCAMEVDGDVKTLRADWSGVVKGVHVEPGDEVSAGYMIAELE